MTETEIEATPSGRPPAPTVWPGLSYVNAPDAIRFLVAERAAAAGAEIVRAVRDEDFGSRGFVARDPEGNLWSFGSYRGA